MAYLRQDYSVKVYISSRTIVQTYIIIIDQFILFIRKAINNNLNHKVPSIIIMSQPNGLTDCSSDWGNSFCITKTLQACISLFLIIWIILQMVNYYHYVRVLKSSFILIVSTLMLLTLAFNIAFSLYHTTYPLYYLQIYFYNMYFSILCYYLIFNVFKRIKHMRAIVGCFIGILSLVYLLILIDSFIQQIQQCQQLSYFIMDSIGVIFCVIMFAAYRYNQVKENKRIQKLNKMLASDEIVIKDQPREDLIKMKMPSRVDFNKPFKLMWLMIICNVFCQIVGLAQTLAFKLSWNINNSNSCQISQNSTINSIINFIFTLFSLYLGFIATIWTFRQKRKAKDSYEARIKSPSDFSSVGSGKGILQMVGKQSFSQPKQNLSNAGDNLSELYEKFNYENGYKNYKQYY